MKKRTRQQSKKKKTVNNVARRNAQIKRLGGHVPAPQLPKAKLAALQATWYKKLKATGFDDIEWTDHSTGDGHNSSYLKRNNVPDDAARYNHQAEFFRRARAYLELNPAWAGYPKPRTFLSDKRMLKVIAELQQARQQYLKAKRRFESLDKAHKLMVTELDFIIWTWFCSGVSYRDISKRLKKERKFTKSLFSVWDHINALIARMVDWHKTSADGIDNEAAQDMIINDVPLRQPAEIKCAAC